MKQWLNKVFAMNCYIEDNKLMSNKKQVGTVANGVVTFDKIPCRNFICRLLKLRPFITISYKSYKAQG